MINENTTDNTLTENTQFISLVKIKHIVRMMNGPEQTINVINRDKA